MILDEERITLSSSSQFIGIAPGCVHVGHGQGRVSFMCVLERHDKFGDRDMQFDNLPQPPMKSAARHFSHDLQDGLVNETSWPYTVGLETLTSDRCVVDRFTTFIIMPDQGNPEIELDGNVHQLGSGWIVGLRPGCPYGFLNDVQVYSFQLHEDWQVRLAALAFEM